MAQRLATEYVKTCLELTEAEMSHFIQLFADHQASLYVKVLENGSQEIVLSDDANTDVVLSFERKHGKYVCTGSCRMTSLKLVNAMRQAVALYKGSATVHRIYRGYTMVYQYERGSVVRITEWKGDEMKLIYEHKDTVAELTELFKMNEVELEITAVQSQIDGLLDARNRMSDAPSRMVVDKRLKQLSHRLFVLEA
ncbi:MAG: non-ribosomal peptide synthetase module [Paenibacillaceae bacterium]|nr:non-ribosomal peptide synthetase module [Paenibacillaceae bacterium]